MYVVRYGNETIHDPRFDSQVINGTVSCQLNEASSLTFEIPPTHPLRGTIAKMDKSNEVTVTKDGTEIFRGRVTQVSVGIDGAESYSCEGQRAYLNDVLLPPYDTSDGTGGAPSSVDGLFAWYVAQYNSKADLAHRFEVGINQGAALDPNNYVLRSSESRVSVWSEIKSKLLDELGGYIRMRVVNGTRYIDYLADAPSSSSQGVVLARNMTSFKRESVGNEIYSSFVAIGKDDDGNEVDISSIADGWINDRYFKRGDAVVDAQLESSMGVVECLYECDAATPSGVYAAAVRAIMAQDYVDSIEVGAYDLSGLGIWEEALEEGIYIRVTNPAADTDAYMICTARDLDLCDPSNDSYTVGITANSASVMAANGESRVRNVREEAAKKAAAAAAKADSKRRVFMTQPTPPYDIGDLWVRTLDDGSTVVMACTTAKEA